MKLGIFWINDDGSIFMTHKVAFDTASRGDSYRVDEMSHPKFWLQNISGLSMLILTVMHWRLSHGSYMKGHISYRAGLTQVLILWIICIRYLKALKNSRHKLRL